MVASRIVGGSEFEESDSLKTDRRRGASITENVLKNSDG